jgi:hypothetical protein
MIYLSANFLYMACTRLIFSLACVRVCVGSPVMFHNDCRAVKDTVRSHRDMFASVVWRLGTSPTAQWPRGYKRIGDTCRYKRDWPVDRIDNALNFMDNRNNDLNICTFSVEFMGVIYKVERLVWRPYSPVFVSGSLRPGISALNFGHVVFSLLDVGHS